MLDHDYSVQLERVTLQHLNKYLDSDSREILLQRARSLKNQIERGKWKFEIPREHPLIFRNYESGLQINIACKIEGTKDNIEKNNIEFLVRTISNNEKIFQFHIDQKDSEAEEPWNHLHFDEFDEPEEEGIEPISSIQEKTPNLCRKTHTKKIM